MKSADAALLRALRTSAIFFPATELAALAGLPLAALATRIGALREAGFEIDERPGLGYRLLTTPDRLIADDLYSRLGNGALIREILVFAETDSTNEQAGKLGRAGAASGLAIFAESQTAGRGRFGRRWESGAHLGLWFSLLLRPVFPLENWPRLTTWAAVAIAAALENTLAVRAEIKWPNDVLIGGKKVAGILIETGVDATMGGFAVVGIGVNANHEAADFPEELAAKATSLRLATSHAVDRPALAAAILRELDRRYADVDRRFPELLAEAARRSSVLHRWVRVRSGNDSLEGVAEGLDANGQLLLRTSDATLQTLSAGEVTLAP